MEQSLAVVDPTPNVTYIYNPTDRRYDVIDLKTGKLVDSVQENISPTLYNSQTADAICDLIREGKTLQSICKDTAFPSTSRFYHWLALHPELRIRYEQARLQRADSFHDRALEIALTMPSKDEVPGCKLAVDTLKWAAEKASPDYYGKPEKIAQGTSINVTLHTGVLDTKAPTDIVIDEFGNFKGFNNEQTNETFTEEPSGTLAKAERWATSYPGSDDREGRVREEETEIKE